MSRAVSPLVGTVLFAGIALVLAAAVGALALGVASPPEPADPVVISASASADGRIELVHEAGPAIDVDVLAVRIAVNGTPLDHQPPVPFFSATGFSSGPTGPFNPATDQTWEVGERASLVVAGTNSPAIDAGSTLEIRIFEGETPMATVETTAE